MGRPVFLVWHARFPLSLPGRPAPGACVMNNDYSTPPGVDLAPIRATQRLRDYVSAGFHDSVIVQTHVVDRLLDRRLELMAARDAEAAWTQ